MNKQELNFDSASCQQHLLKITHNRTDTPKRLLLLHGAGVGGELTWLFLASYLKAWDEIYIPDLAGMGKASFLNNTAPTLADYLQQLDEILAELQLSKQNFDMAGYSFGGMLLERWLRDAPFNNLVFLLEPAMLFSGDCQQVLDKSQCYGDVAARLRQDPQDISAYQLFLDSVSPRRDKSEGGDDLVIKRLMDNPLGFASALAAITMGLQAECQYYTRWQSPWHGASFVGGLSWQVMHQRHQRLAQESLWWHYEVVPNADHSLVFTRPRSIAKVMNTLAERYY